jgi:hypothetical protein
MVTLTVEKKDILNASKMLAQVAGLKSPGATPAENSSIQLSLQSMSLFNTNEANSISIENIPLAIKNGDISPHLESAININTHKLATVIKSTAKQVELIIDRDSITINTGKGQYKLNAYQVDAKKPFEVRFCEEKVPEKELANLFRWANILTSNLETFSDLSGVLIAKGYSICTDRQACLYYENSIFDNYLSQDQDILINPDLFATCLSNKSDEAISYGITEDGKRMAIRIGNTTLYKTLLAGNFPKSNLVSSINKIKGQSTFASATVNVKDFISKIEDHRSIVESGIVCLTIDKSLVSISSTNSKVGAEGIEIIESKDNTVPSELGKEAVALFSTDNLLFIGQIFSDLEEVSICERLISDTKKADASPKIGCVFVKTDKIVYFATAKSEG